MDFNLPENLQYCRSFVSELTNILFYTHVPAIIIAILIGIYVYYKNKSLLSGILLALVVTFSFWSALDLLIWIFFDKNSLVMFSWAIVDLLDITFFLLSLYFVYVYFDGKDVSFLKKLAFILILMPAIILSPTKFSLSHFDLQECIAVENSSYLNYIFFSEILIAAWIIFISIHRIFKGERKRKGEISILSLGIIIFLASFFLFGYISEQTGNYAIEQYGLFGMVIFMGFLAYLIVKFKAFDIKLLAAQALVVALIILVGSQFFYVQSNTGRILTGITLVLAVGFGWALIKSVKNEVKRKEELQLMSDKLAMANDQLRKLDNAKSEFISIASHQLRTPLTAIKGFVSLLLEGTYDEVSTPQREALNKVYLSCERLIQLVENLLNVSRIESGRIEYEFRKWRPEDIIKEISDSLVFAARNKGLYLHLDLPQKGLPEIEVDGAKIKEVVSNLVDNAVKYTRRGGVTVRAELSQFPISLPRRQAGNSQFPIKSQITNSEIRNTGDCIRITISDTGIGVPEADLPYLFSKFSRGKDTGRLHVTGTGLGLYVGKSIVDAHHGKIWVESEGENKGSRFIVELPLSQEKFRRQERVEEFVKEI